MYLPCGSSFSGSLLCTEYNELALFTVLKTVQIWFKLEGDQKRSRLEHTLIKLPKFSICYSSSINHMLFVVRPKITPHCFWPD